MQSRYYNPEWGRFINADAITGSVGELIGHNLFAYCKNNPANLSDPSGYRSIPAFDVESDIVEIDDKWEAEIADVKESGGSKTINVSDNNGSSYKHTTPWGSCHYNEIEIKKVDMTVGNKEFGFTKGFEIRAYYKGDYEWDNALDDTITNIGIFVGIAGKTKFGKQLMDSISKRINPDTVSGAGLLVFTGGQAYDYYTRRYNKGLMPDYDILYNSFHH